MANDSAYYKLGARLKRDNRNINTIIDGAVRLATVSSVSPFKLKIGQSEYSSEHWMMYESELAGNMTGKSAVFKGAWIGEEGGTLSASSSMIDEVQMQNVYKVGDLLAVVEISSGNEFIILSRLRRV